jgi:lysozyme
MNDNLRTSLRGVALIKRFEGFRAKAYICPAGVLTIGYGTTKNVRPGQVVTEPEASVLLQQDLVVFEAAIKQLVSVPLTQYQFDALACFVYNVGSGNFKSSSLLRLLNAGSYTEVPAQLMRWNKGGGKVLPGLTTRRQAEGALWNNQDA